MLHLIYVSISRYYKYINYGFTFIKQDITYASLQHADNCDIKVYTEDMNEVPEHIKKIISVQHRKNKYTHYDECTKNECFLHFIDPTLKHKHKIGSRRNKQQDIIII